MMLDDGAGLSRRKMLGAGAALVGGLALVPATAMPAAPQSFAISGQVPPALLRRALASLRFHSRSVPLRDRLAIVDFTASSAQPRFHIVDLANGRTTSLLVAHGSGSDPAHTGWLERFSNDDGSNASSEGAFVATDYYVGKHGRSQRLVGLDPTNNNALRRNLVVHSAWYSNPEMIAQHGMLGRSQGCFAVGQQDLDLVFAKLGQGRMIFADKV